MSFCLSSLALPRGRARKNGLGSPLMILYAYSTMQSISLARAHCKREDLRLQGGTGSKTGCYQSEKGDETRAHNRGSHDNLTNGWNPCVFRSDGVFGNHRLAGPGRLPMVESFLSDVSEVRTTDTTERP